MSTPLQIAVDIVGAVTRSRAASAPLDVASLAAEISRRNAPTALSASDIAEALTAEALAAGVPFAPVPRLN